MCKLENWCNTKDTEATNRAGDIDISSYRVDYDDNKKERGREEQEEAQIDNPDNVLLALNDDFSDVYEKLQKMQENELKEIKYCIENGTLKTFNFPFLNNKKEKDYINFRICWNWQTVELWHAEKGKLWTMTMVEIEPQKWSIDCSGSYNSDNEKICYNKIEECLDFAVNLCVK